jgi:hypothetical protein
MAKLLKDTEPGDRRKVGELIRAIRVAFLTTALTGMAAGAIGENRKVE